MTSKKILKLSGPRLKELELKNEARIAVGLSPIHLKVRSCMSCKQLFESDGNRTCGCNTGKFNYSPAVCNYKLQINDIQISEEPEMI